MAAAARRRRGALRVARPHQDARPKPADRLGVRCRAVRRRAELDCDGVHLPVEHAGMAGLDRGRPAVALPRRLPGACRRTGLALRARRPRRAGDRARRRVGRDRMAPRDGVHRLPVEPGRGGDGADAADRRDAADRHLWSVDAGRAARWRHLARILSQVAAAGGDPGRNGLPVAAAIVARARRPADHPHRPHRPAEHRAAGQVEARLQRSRGAAARDPVRSPVAGGAAAAVARSRSRTRAPTSTRRWRNSNAPAPAPCSDPATGC